MRRVLPLALALGALLAPAAHAGPPFTVGEGFAPHLVVDSAGTAHVTWRDETRTVYYCRIQRGGRSCPRPTTLASPADGNTFLVYGAGSTLYLVQPDPGGARTLLWTSPDNGLTWGPQQQIYRWGGGTGTAPPVFGPQPNQLTFASPDPSTTAWAAAVDGSESESEARATLSQTIGYDAQPAGTPDGGMVVVANDLTSSFFHRLPPGADPSDPAAWSGPAVIGRGAQSRVASGPGGTYMLTTLGPANARQQIRKWNGTTFGRPRSISENGAANDIFVAPSGAVAAAWRLSSRARNRLRLALSTDGGARFTLQTIAIEDTVMADMDIALAPDNKGFATYEGRAAADASRALIRVATTEPIIENVVSPDPPSVKRDTARVRGATLQLSATGNCVRAGSRFSASVTARKRTAAFAGIGRVDFLLGFRRAATDRRRPFLRRISLRKAVSGRSYTLRARVRYRLRGRATLATKTLKLTIRTCPRA